MKGKRGRENSFYLRFLDSVSTAQQMIIWLMVYLPLWKIWKSVGMIIPNIWKKNMFQATNQIWCSVYICHPDQHNKFHQCQASGWPSRRAWFKFEGRCWQRHQRHLQRIVSFVVLSGASCEFEVSRGLPMSIPGMNRNEASQKEMIWIHLIPNRT